MKRDTIFGFKELQVLQANPDYLVVVAILGSENNSFLQEKQGMIYLVLKQGKQTDKFYLQHTILSIVICTSAA